MINVIFKVNVAYPNKFIEVVNSQREARKALGERSLDTRQHLKIPNILLVISSWDSEQAARSYWASEEAKLHISSWRSVEQPMLEYFQCR